LDRPYKRQRHANHSLLFNIIAANVNALVSLFSRNVYAVKMRLMPVLPARFAFYRPL